MSAEDAADAPDAEKNKSSVVQPARSGREANNVTGKICGYCGVTSTPVWRTGPNKEPLCNKCGLQAARKRRKKEAGSQQEGSAQREGGSAAKAARSAGAAGLGPQAASNAAAAAVAGPFGAQAATSPLQGPVSASLGGGQPLLGGAFGLPAGGSVPRPGPTAAGGGAAIPQGFSSLSGVHMVVLPPAEPAAGGSSPGGIGGRPPSPPAPRLVQNATVVLEEVGGPAPLTHSSFLPVCLAAYDSWGQRLLASERFDVMPQLEYDPVYGSFVYDSGQDWWLLLPRAEQTEVFKALMHKFSMMKATRMGLLPRPAVDLLLDGGGPLGQASSSGGFAAAAGAAGAGGAAGGGPVATQPRGGTTGALGLGPQPAAEAMLPNPPLPSLLSNPAQTDDAPAGSGAVPAAQQPGIMQALSGLLAGWGGPAAPDGGSAGGRPPLLQAEPCRAGAVQQQQQQEQPPKAGAAGGPGGGGRQLEEQDAMQLLGSLTALGSGGLLGGASGLGITPLVSSDGPLAQRGSGDSVKQEGAAAGGIGGAGGAGSGKGPSPAGGTGGAAGTAPSGGAGWGQGLLLGGSGGGRGSLDLAELWEPTLSGFNSRALSGLTQALLGFGGAGGGAGLGGGALATGTGLGPSHNGPGKS